MQEQVGIVLLTIWTFIVGIYCGITIQKNKKQKPLK